MNHQDDECNKGQVIPRKIRLARNPAVFICLIQCVVYIYITGSGWLGFNVSRGGWFNFAFAILWAIMALGIYKYIRTCAIIALALYIFENLIVELIPPGRSFSVAWLVGIAIWLLCFSSGIISCWMQHKYKVTGIDNSENIKEGAI